MPLIIEVHKTWSAKYGQIQMEKDDFIEFDIVDIDWKLERNIWARTQMVRNQLTVTKHHHLSHEWKFE